MKPITTLNCLNLRPTIVISHKGLEAIKHIVSIAPQEAQWFHTVTPLTFKNSPGEIFLHLSEKLYIPKQNTSLAQVDSTSSMMMEFYKELKEEYSDQELVNQKLNSMSCWCHSHHNMSPNPSSQDNLQFNSFVNSSIDQQQNVWQVMLIFNKKHQFYSRVYDPRTGLIIEGVEIQVDHNYDFSYINEAAKEKFLAPKPKVKSKFNWGNKFQHQSFSTIEKFLKEENINIEEDPYDIELDLASDVVASIYGDCSLKNKARITTQSIQENLLATLDNFLDEKELQILSYILLNTPQKIADIFTDSRFSKNKINPEILLERITHYFTTTNDNVSRVMFAFRDTFVFSELPNLKACNNYIKEILNA